jgi:hypothetical protein
MNPERTAPEARFLRKKFFQKGIQFENVTGIGKKLFLTSQTAIDKEFYQRHGSPL